MCRFSGFYTRASVGQKGGKLAQERTTRTE